MKIKYTVHSVEKAKYPLAVKLENGTESTAEVPHDVVQLVPDEHGDHGGALKICVPNGSLVPDVFSKGATVTAAFLPGSWDQSLVDWIIANRETIETSAKGDK